MRAVASFGVLLCCVLVINMWNLATAGGKRIVNEEIEDSEEYEYGYDYLEEDEGEGKTGSQGQENSEVQTMKKKTTSYSDHHMSSGYRILLSKDVVVPPRPYMFAALLDEIESTTTCLRRNHTHMQKLRDDHRLSLKQEREQKRLKRKEKREQQAQELAEIVEENEEKRIKMARMNSIDLLELEAQEQRIERAKVQKQSEAEELLKDKKNILVVGEKVMARYQRKSKYLFGNIRAARPDGTYDIAYQNGKVELRVDRSLIIKPESEKEIVHGSRIGRNEELIAKTKVLKEHQQDSFAQMQAIEDELKAEDDATTESEAQDPGRLMGSDCESLACGSCKIVVDEFAQRVYKNIDNVAVQTLEDLLAFKIPFCSSPNIAIKYSPVVEYVCKKLFSAKDQRDFVISAFEADAEWSNVLNPSKLRRKQQKICTASGFCDASYFQYQYDMEKDEGWESSSCYVCHAVMEDFEEKASLYRKVDDIESINIARGGCNNLELDVKLAAECESIMSDSLIYDVAWIIKLHYENIQKKLYTHRSFPDMACENLSMCKRYVESLEDEKESIYREVEPVFS